MYQLELAIKEALESNKSELANKAYLEFIKANFMIPIDKNSKSNEPQVLYVENKGDFFLPVFTNKSYLDSWAHEISSAIHILSLSGVDLLKGLGEGVSVCLNIGSPIYKEFNPSELERMKSMVLKLGTQLK